MVALFAPSGRFVLKNCHDWYQSFPECGAAAYNEDRIVDGHIYRPICYAVYHNTLKVTAQVNEKQVSHIFEKKSFAFFESSCIIQTGFSSFESIQTKILDEIEGSPSDPLKSTDINKITNIEKKGKYL